MSTLELNGVRKSFGPQEALKGIDLALGTANSWCCSAPRAAASPPCSN